MPLIMNCLDKENQVTIGGNTFTFAPKQIKMFYQTDVASMITSHRRTMGFVSVPDELEYLTIKPKPGTELSIDPEHVTIINEARQQGIDAYVENLRRLIYNEQVSLKMDYDRKGLKSDTRLELHPNMIKNMEEVIKYQAKKEDKAQAQLDKVKELEKKLESSK